MSLTSSAKVPPLADGWGGTGLVACPLGGASAEADAVATGALAPGAAATEAEALGGLRTGGAALASGAS